MTVTGHLLRERWPRLQCWAPTEYVCWYDGPTLATAVTYLCGRPEVEIEERDGFFRAHANGCAEVLWRLIRPRTLIRAVVEDILTAQVADFVEWSARDPFSAQDRLDDLDLPADESPCDRVDVEIGAQLVLDRIDVTRSANETAAGLQAAMVIDDFGFARFRDVVASLSRDQPSLHQPAVSRR